MAFGPEEPLLYAGAFHRSHQAHPPGRVTQSPPSHLTGNLAQSSNQIRNTTIAASNPARAVRFDVISEVYSTFQHSRLPTQQLPS